MIDNPVYQRILAEYGTDSAGFPNGAEMITDAILHEAITPLEIAEEIKREITSDVASGQLPKDVASFSELHDFVDANEYFLLTVGYDPSPMAARISDMICDMVNQWLAGRPFE